MRRLPIVLVLLAAAAAAAIAWQWPRLQAGLGLGARESGALTLYGNVDIRQVELGFRVAGRLAGMRPEEGDRVSAGDVLATLDQAPFQDRSRQATAQVAVARANLDKLEAGSRPEEIAEAEANVDERQAVLRNADRTLARRRSLVGKGATAEEQLDQARAASDQAKAALEAARQALALAKAGFRKEDVAAGRASLAAAEAEAASAATALADTVLRAPSDGVVLARVREPGAIVAAGETVYTLSLTRPVWVRAYVPEPDLGLVRPGLVAEVTTDSGGRTYRGQVGFVSPVAEFTPKSVETPELRTSLVYRLRVIVADPDDGLRQGMPVTVRFPSVVRREAR